MLWVLVVLLLYAVAILVTMAFILGPLLAMLAFFLCLSLIYPRLRFGIIGWAHSWFFVFRFLTSRDSIFNVGKGPEVSLFAASLNVRNPLAGGLIKTDASVTRRICPHSWHLVVLLSLQAACHQYTPRRRCQIHQNPSLMQYAG